LDISEEFIRWVKLLFGSVSAVVNLNGIHGNIFKIEKGVRQGCPLASYLLLIVGEVLTHIIKKAIAKGKLRMNTHPRGRGNNVYCNIWMTHHLWSKGINGMWMT
jgi:hypothetical protein